MSAIEYEIKRQGDDFSDVSVQSSDMDNLRPLPRISIHAFCESDTVQSTIERLTADRRMSKVSFRITNGEIDAAATMFTSSPTPNVIILETNRPENELLQALTPLAEVCDPSTRVIIIGRYNDVNLYRDLLKNGISEYLVAPLNMTDLYAAIASIFIDPDAEPLGRNIAFIGSKGGVGSSVLAHNCAFSISQIFETETILADFDLPFGTVNIDFDQDPAQGIAEAVYSPERLDDVFLDRLLTKCSDHLSILAAPSLLDRSYDFENLTFQPLMELLHRAAPISIIDIPHIWNGWVQTVLSDADEIVVTAVPDLASLRNTKNILDAIKKLRPNDKPPHLILNQVGLPKRPEISVADFSAPLGVSPIAVIPFDAQLFGNAANSGRMLMELDSKSQISETIAEIAHIITGRSVGRKAKKSGISMLMEKLRGK